MHATQLQPSYPPLLPEIEGGEEQSRSSEFEAGLVAELPALRARASFLERSGNTTASDLVQDTLERALSNWFRFRAGTDLRRWLFVIMQNLFADDCRKRKRSRESASPDVADTEEDPISDGAPPACLPDALALLDRLTAPLQETVRLVVLDGRSYREAAERLGVPTPTVGTRMARARAKLRAFALSGPAEAG
jgi:RNA polymerase sigma-70 factor, ECF subfamily